MTTVLGISLILLRLILWVTAGLLPVLRLQSRDRGTTDAALELTWMGMLRLRQRPIHGITGARIAPGADQIVELSTPEGWVPLPAPRAKPQRVLSDDDLSPEMARVRDWVAGPTLNVFNPATLALLQEGGATRWAVAPEMSGAALAELRAHAATPIETEVFAYGRLPLAHSARCFTARHFNLQKDTCEFRCLSIMDGIVLRTREGEPFLTLNGVQTQSARVHNLLGDLDAVRPHAELLRISPQGAHTAEILALFRRALDGALAPAEALAASRPLMVEDPCNGFWHGRAGAEQYVAAA